MGGAAIAAMLNEPSNICFDKIGNLYIIDDANYRIRKVDTFGVITTVAGTGISGYTIDGVHADSAEIEDMYGICADTIGNIYFGIQDSMMVRKIDTAGILTTIGGNGTGVPSGDGGPAINANLEPMGLAFDHWGNLYISGFIENDVRKINDSGIIYTVAGNTIAGYSGDGGPADSAELYHPYGIAIDGYGNLYIADDLNYRIRKVTFNPVIIPAITITASTVDTICSGTSVTFTAIVVGDTTPVYQWLVNGSPVGTDSTYSYTPANGDSIRCILSVPGLCTIPGSNIIHMVVDTFIKPIITISSNPVATLGSTVTVNATVADAGSIYIVHWYNNSILFNTTTTPSVTYTKTIGIDQITATVIPSSVGCYDSTTSSVITITDSSTGLNNIAMPQDAYIYPNPAHSGITVISQNITNVTVSNVLGQTFVNKECNANQININIETLPSGVYVVKLTNNEGQKTITKIVKE